MMQSIRGVEPWSNPTSSTKSPNKTKRKGLPPRNILQWTHSKFIPPFFRLAYIGLFVLFFVYKFFINLYYSVVIKMNQIMSFMTRSISHSSKKRVVIVGGGYAGTYAAKQLELNFDVVLIDIKDYYEFTPSRLRTLVEPNHTHRVQINYSSILSKTAIVTDRVETVTNEAVVCASGESYPYDYLILSTGSRYLDPVFPPFVGAPASNFHAKILSGRTPNLDSYHPLLNRSNKILVIGGGTVGVELAGEIIEQFPDKEVTLIHSQSKLINRSPDRVGSYSEDFFKRTNVSVVLGERITEQTGIYFRTSSGTVVEADLAFVCTGNIPNSEYLKSTFPQSLNRYGFVKVNECLQMEGTSRIFVAGDLTDIPAEEEKLCQTAYDEIKVAVTNIFNLERQRKLTGYTPSPCPMLISLGKYDGILTYRGWTFTGFIPALMKEFVEWKEMVWYWGWEHFRLYTPRKVILKGDLPYGHAHVV